MPRRAGTLIHAASVWPIRAPRAALAFAALLALASALCALRLKPDTSLEAMFSRDDPAGRAMMRIMGQFSSAEELLILASLPDEGAPPAPELLRRYAQRAEEALKGSPMVQRVIWRADADMENFFREVLVLNALFYLSDAEFQAAKERLSAAQMLAQFRQNEAMISAPGPAAQALSKAFLKDPLRLHEFILERLGSSRPFATYGGSDAFISPDGRAILIRVRGVRPPSDMDFAKRFTSEIERIATTQNDAHLRLEFAGSYAIAATAEAGIRRDMIATIVGSVISLQILFVLAYRRPWRVFMLAFAPVAIGVLYGFGFYAIGSTSISPMTAVIGGILAGMGIDYSIQYLSHYHASRASGLAPRDAASATTTIIGPAIFAAYFTSIIGFVAIGFSRVQMLRQFAIVGTLGLTGAFIGTIFILPALLILLDRRSGKQSASRFTARPLLNRLRAHRRIAVAFCTILLLGSAVTLASSRDWLPLESDLTVMHPRPNAALDAQRHIAERFGGSAGSLIVHLKASSAADLLTLAHRVRARLDAQREAGITGTFSIATLLPDPQIAPMRARSVGPDLADQVVADFRAVIAQSIFDPAAFAPYEQFLRRLLTATTAPDLSSLASYPALAETVLPKSTAPGSATESMMLVFARGDLDERGTRERIVRAISGGIGDIPGATLTGLSVLAHKTEAIIRRDLPRFVLIAGAIVALYLLVHFRRPLDMLLALLPALFGLLTLLAFMRLFDQRLNMVSIAALPLLVGIDVDYGIFIVHIARKKGSDPVLIAPAFEAVVLCAGAAIIGFASLLTTSVPAVRSLGIAMSAGMALCMAGTLLLLIPLLPAQDSHAAPRQRGG